jgi:2-oxoglutarate ferredoxin oxidoreductase subunit alpha
MDRCKNFFALGMCYWLYNRSMDTTTRYLESKFKDKPQIIEANKLAMKAGHVYCEATEAFQVSYEIPKAKLPPGRYRNISGNSALAIGLVAASEKSGIPLFLGSYPITPASDILHELSKLKNFGVKTLQSEDEIAAAGAAVGAAFAGSLGVTATSGPGVDLKSETIGLAISLELPLVLIDVQRGGPSTGLPTKTEQADLMLAMYGRHGESPLPIVAAQSPADCFDAAFEAVRIALKFRTPVILLTDGYLANAAEPWNLPDLDALPDISVPFATELNHGDEFWPYLRDPETLARPWAIPGTPKLMHRVGGLEKEDGTGNVSYDAENHDFMTRIRAAKIAGIASDIPPVDLDDEDGAEFLVVTWGGTWGAAKAAVSRVRSRGHKIAHAHLRHMNPFPADLGDIVQRFPKIFVPEINLGQLSRLLRAEFLVDARSYGKMFGVPFHAADLEERILEMMAE